VSISQAQQQAGCPKRKCLPIIGDFQVPTGRGGVIETRARVVEKLTTPQESRSNGTRPKADWADQRGYSILLPK
jgi:hypothetical protein